MPPARLPVPRNKTEWIELAALRIERILKVRVAATIRQLEVKICESGPPSKRPEPHILSSGLEKLRESGRLRVFQPPGESRQNETKFYSLVEHYPNATKARVNELLVPYRVHRMFAQTAEYSGNVLEEIVRASFKAADSYRYEGKLPKNTPLDGVYIWGGTTLGVEVKNVREWIYPHSDRVWAMVRKCLELNADRKSVV